ncbi:hypothetical protein BDN72DRAFT_861897 [Pluteus cervinus]|uniref:Uncharacterized protein n=1 Tax=Pluteus cervinus TaxID=181527 RepID=A0ACD3ADN4_9AGAR|nr:hypothetical protein BDN72DRAFT_861897 [Pluteus cervinus]
MFTSRQVSMARIYHPNVHIPVGVVSVAPSGPLTLDNEAPTTPTAAPTNHNAPRWRQPVTLASPSLPLTTVSRLTRCSGSPLVFPLFFPRLTINTTFGLSSAVPPISQAVKEVLPQTITPSKVNSLGPGAVVRRVALCIYPSGDKMWT